MSETKHTPGPWSGSEPQAGFAEIRDASGDLVFGVCYPSLGMGDKARTAEECSANFALALAAPDLLEACLRALTALEVYGAHAGVIDSVKDAIAKAKVAA